MNLSRAEEGHFASAGAVKKTGDDGSVGCEGVGAMTDKPLMSDAEIAIMSQLLQDRRPRRCLEWGSGASTTYWSRLPPIRQWLSLEHDYSWYLKVCEDKINRDGFGHVDVVYIPDLDVYSQWPQGQFDFILVDGRNRVKCMEHASSILSPDGVCVLHDSARARYKAGWNAFDKHHTLCDGETVGAEWHRGLTIFTNSSVGLSQ